MQLPSVVYTFVEPWLLFLADDPALRALQMGMLFLGAVVIFLVFFTTRDILLRTHSFWYMLVCILLVAMLPIVGFFLYLLIRPPRTLKERELEGLLLELARREETRQEKEKKATKEAREVKEKKRTKDEKDKKGIQENLSL